jgi:hypothetical protein
MAQQSLEPDAPGVEERLRAHDGAHRPFHVGDPLPIRMSPEDMQRAFRFGHTRFYQLVDAGHFDRFEILPRIGNRAWSGERVARYLAGETRTHSFGRKRAG